MREREREREKSDRFNQRYKQPHIILLPTANYSCHQQTQSRKFTQSNTHTYTTLGAAHTLEYDNFYSITTKSNHTNASVPFNRGKGEAGVCQQCTLQSILTSIGTFPCMRCKLQTYNGLPHYNIMIAAKHLSQHTSRYDHMMTAGSMHVT